MLPTTLTISNNEPYFRFLCQKAGRRPIVNLSSNSIYLRTMSSRLTGGALVIWVLAGCAPTINLATPAPIKVDVGVRLDVYQKSAPTKAKEEQSSLEIAANRRLRSGEIQQLKNNRIIGEDRDGYLAMRNAPQDPKYLEYVQGIIAAENADRSYLYLGERAEPEQAAGIG